jgi:hypothetical protein
MFDQHRSDPAFKETNPLPIRRGRDLTPRTLDRGTLDRPPRWLIPWRPLRLTPTPELRLHPLSQLRLHPLPRLRRHVRLPGRPRPLTRRDERPLWVSRRCLRVQLPTHAAEHHTHRRNHRRKAEPNRPRSSGLPTIAALSPKPNPATAYQWAAYHWAA